MRITNSMMRNKLLSNLNTNLERLDKYQRQVETQKRITKLSDDPVGVITAMQARAKMGQLERNLEAVRDARTWTENADYAYQDIEKIFVNAYELTIDLASDEANPGDRQNGAEVIKQLMEQLVQTANSSVGSQYMFAGFNTDKAPFEVDASGKLLYNGFEMYPTPDTANLDKEAEEIIQFEVGYGIKMDVSFTGVKLMGTGSDNLYGVLNDLYNDMMDDTKSAEDIGKHVEKLLGAQEKVLSQVAEIGGREVRLDMIEDRYEQEHLNYNTRMSLVEDVDISEAMINLSTAQAVYNAALQTGAKIIQPSLMDYIR